MRVPDFSHDLTNATLLDIEFPLGNSVKMTLVLFPAFYPEQTVVEVYIGGLEDAGAFSLFAAKAVAEARQGDEQPRVDQLHYDRRTRSETGSLHLYIEMAGEGRPVVCKTLIIRELKDQELETIQALTDPKRNEG